MRNVSNLTVEHALHGMKTALAAVLAYALTIFFDLEFGYWAVITTVIVMQVYVADSVEMCLNRFSGTLIGALIGILVMLVVPQNHVVAGAALFITIGFCSFLTRYKARYRMAAITVVILVMTGIQSENVFLFGLSRVFEILLGILCAFIVSVTIFPRKAADVLVERLGGQAEKCLEKSGALVDAFIARQKRVEITFVDNLVKAALDNHAILQKVSRHETVVYHKNFSGDFSGKVSVMVRSAEHLRNMVRTLNALYGEGYDIIMSKELRTLAQESGNVLVSLMKNQPLEPGVKDLEKAIDEVKTGFSDLRQKGVTRRFDTPRLVQVFSFYSSLVYFAEDIFSAAGAELDARNRI